MRRSVIWQGCPQVLVILGVTVLTACADAGRGLTAPAGVEPLSAVATSTVASAARRPGDLTVFRFGIRGSTTEDFLAATNDAQMIANVRAQLQLPEADRGLHINGYIGRARQQSNLQWSWQYLDSEWRLAEISFGACDANPSTVEANLRAWMKRGTQLCPFSSYVKEEVPE